MGNDLSSTPDSNEGERKDEEDGAEPPAKRQKLVQALDTDSPAQRAVLGSDDMVLIGMEFLSLEDKLVHDRLPLVNKRAWMLLQQKKAKHMGAFRAATTERWWYIMDDGRGEEVARRIFNSRMPKVKALEFPFRGFFGTVLVNKQARQSFLQMIQCCPNLEELVVPYLIEELHSAELMPRLQHLAITDDDSLDLDRVMSCFGPQLLSLRVFQFEPDFVPKWSVRSPLPVCQLQSLHIAMCSNITEALSQDGYILTHIGADLRHLSLGNLRASKTGGDALIHQIKVSCPQLTELRLGGEGPGSGYSDASKANILSMANAVVLCFPDLTKLSFDFEIWETGILVNFIIQMPNLCELGALWSDIVADQLVADEVCKLNNHCPVKCIVDYGASERFTLPDRCPVLFSDFQSCTE